VNGVCQGQLPSAGRQSHQPAIHGGIIALLERPVPRPLFIRDVFVLFIIDWQVYP
jgi:hypothetical protein